MAAPEKNPVNLSDSCDDYYEKVASQEEIYLEENEEEVEIIMEESPAPPQEDFGEERMQAVENLITGDSDDPPLSYAAIGDLLKSS